MKFTDLDEAYRLRHLVLYLEEMWRWADNAFDEAVGEEEPTIRLTPSVLGDEFGPLHVTRRALLDIVRALYVPAIRRLHALRVDVVGLLELMPDDEPVGKPKRPKKPKPEETDFGNLSPEQKKQWADQIWQQGRDQNFWLMKFSPDDLFIIERPGSRKLRWLREYSPMSWTADPSKALRLPRDQADQIAGELGNVVLQLVEPAAQPEPEAE